MFAVHCVVSCIVALTEPYTNSLRLRRDRLNYNDCLYQKITPITPQDSRCLTDMEYVSCGELDAVLIIMS